MIKENLINAALGKCDADLILKGGNVYNVFTGELQTADIAVKDGFICGVGSYSGKNEHDVSGKYILPGFIDSHMHIESSMVTPDEYAKAAMAHGVTTVIADPHEITNVCGEDGLKFMKECAETVPLDIHFMLPSCVPATPFEHSGSVLTAADTQRLAKDFFGIGEMMNYPGVLAADPEVMGKLVDGKVIDGHAPLLDGRELDAYVCAGIKTDHECSLASELQEKIGKGMYIMLREGTLSKDIEKLAPGVTPQNSRYCLFCTDDRFIGEIAKDGSIDFCIKRAVQCGIDEKAAVNMATINAAQCYGLKIGALAPSYAADILVCDSLTPGRIFEVYKDGKLAVKDGVPTFSGKTADTSAVTDSVHLDPVDESFFKCEMPPRFKAIELIPRSIITKCTDATPDMPLSKVCVIERHHRTGFRGFAFVTNYGIKNAAVASSIGHDSHNITVIGDNDRDMALAVNTLGKSGGFAVCQNGKVLEYLPLEIAGLMSAKTAEEVIEIHRRLDDAAKAVSITEGIDPFLSLAFLSLPVIPQIRITDSGLYDVVSGQFIKQ